MKTKLRFLLLIASVCLLLLTSSFSATSAKAPEATQAKRPAIALSTLHANSLVFSPSIYPEGLFPEYEETMRLVMTDSALTSEERADYLSRLDKAYKEKEDAYYAALPGTKVMHHTFDCETDSSYHEITLVYTKHEILRFETTTLRTAENVILSYSVDAPTEATFSLKVDDPDGDARATVVFKLLENGKLTVRSTSVSND